MNPPVCKPYILAIDNDQYFLNEIGYEIKDKAKYKSFLGPKEFADDVFPEDIQEANLILVDYNYPTGNAIKSKIVEYIKDILGFKGKVILFSHFNYFEENNQKVQDLFDGFILKGEFEWNKLLEHL